jgi:DNA-binding PadR family transcriptional regulator
VTSPNPLALRPLGVMILALLREGDMHPYEMMRTLRARREDRLVKLQNGTFYHQVATLERDGFIAQQGVEREGNRPERTTYTLLPAGRAATADWVRDRIGTGNRLADLRVALAEAHNLPREEFARLMRARLEVLQAEYLEWRGGLDGAYARGVDPQYLIEGERSLALLKADIDWTERLLAQLADRAFSWQCSPEHEAGATGATSGAAPAATDAAGGTPAPVPHPQTSSPNGAQA